MDTQTPTPPPEEQKMRSFRLSKGGEKKEIPKSAKVIGWIVVAYFLIDIARTLLGGS